MSDYVASIRSRIGTDLLLLPGVTAVIRDDDRFLLARHRHSGLWSLIGGGVEPGEEPVAALLREVLEETEELLELGWFPRDAIPSLPRRDWIDRVIADAPGGSSSS